MLSDVRYHAPAKKIDQRSSLGRADDEIIDAHGGGKIDNGGGGILTDRVNRDDANVALGSEFHHQRHNRVRFRIIVPFRAAKRSRSTRIVDSNLFDEEHAKSGFAQLRFIERKPEYGRNAASGDHDFLAFLQTRLHARFQIRPHHFRDFTRNSQRGQALSLLGVSTKRKSSAQNYHHEKERVLFGVLERYFDND